MARPTKSAKLLTEKSQTKAEIRARIENENKLKGDNDKLRPPKHLNKNQKKIFKAVVDGLESADILGNLDIYLLANFSVCLDRIWAIDKKVNEDISLIDNIKLVNARSKYMQDFFRCCNELSLSPQSRAKIANTKAEDADELKEFLLNG